MIVLDTHAWVWWVAAPDLLSSRAREAVEEARHQGELFVSSFSVWEVTMLVKRGRLRLTSDLSDWLARSEALPFLTFVPVDNHVARRSVELPPPLHADPADRLIVATTLVLGARLVTKDRHLLDYPGVGSVW